MNTAGKALVTPKATAGKAVNAGSNTFTTLQGVVNVTEQVARAWTATESRRQVERQAEAMQSMASEAWSNWSIEQGRRYELATAVLGVLRDVQPTVAERLADALCELLTRDAAPPQLNVIRPVDNDARASAALTPPD